MNRFLYCNLLKIIFNLLLICVFIPSVIYLICSLLFDKVLNIPSLVLIILCGVLWIILNVVIFLLNRISKNKIIFEENRIQYKNMILNKDNLSIKYFKFHISVIEPSLVIPRLHINGNNLSITCYLSKRDIKYLEKLNYKIYKV